MLFVVPPGLPLEFTGRQVLLQAAWLVVEGKEQGFTVQLLEERRVVKDGQLLSGIGCRHRSWIVLHAQWHGGPHRI